LRNPQATRPWQHVLEPLSGYLLLAERLYSEGSRWAEGWNFGPLDEDARSVEYVVENLTRRWGDGARWIAPPGKHLAMSHQAVISDDLNHEIALGLLDLKRLFPGKKYEVLLIQSYSNGWPVNRASSGNDIGNRTPVRNLYVVGDGAKGKGGIEVEGVALGVRNVMREMGIT